MDSVRVAFCHVHISLNPRLIIWKHNRYNKLHCLIPNLDSPIIACFDYMNANPLLPDCKVPEMNTRAGSFKHLCLQKHLLKLQPFLLQLHPKKNLKVLNITLTLTSCMIETVN